MNALFIAGVTCLAVSSGWFLVIGLDDWLNEKKQPRGVLVPAALFVLGIAALGFWAMS